MVSSFTIPNPVIKVVIKVASKSLKRKERNCTFENLSLRWGPTKKNCGLALFSATGPTLKLNHMMGLQVCVPILEFCVVTNSNDKYFKLIQRIHCKKGFCAFPYIFKCECNACCVTWNLL